MELAGSTFPILLHTMSCNDLQLASNKSQRCCVCNWPPCSSVPFLPKATSLLEHSISRHFKVQTVQTSLLLPFYGLFSDPVVL